MCYGASVIFTIEPKRDRNKSSKKSISGSAHLGNDGPFACNTEAVIMRGRGNISTASQLGIPIFSQVTGVFPKWNRNSVNSANSGNLINH